jgi:hypothetical protein
VGKYASRPVGKYASSLVGKYVSGLVEKYASRLVGSMSSVLWRSWQYYPLSILLSFTLVIGIKLALILMSAIIQFRNFRLTVYLRT